MLRSSITTGIICFSDLNCEIDLFLYIEFTFHCSVHSELSIPRYWHCQYFAYCISIVLMKINGKTDIVFRCVKTWQCATFYYFFFIDSLNSICAIALFENPKTFSYYSNYAFTEINADKKIGKYWYLYMRDMCVFVWGFPSDLQYYNNRSSKWTFFTPKNTMHIFAVSGEAHFAGSRL